MLCVFVVIAVSARRCPQVTGVTMPLVKPVKEVEFLEITPVRISSLDSSELFSDRLHSPVETKHMRSVRPEGEQIAPWNRWLRSSARFTLLHPSELSAWTLVIPTV